ncbi:MAG: DMT family transporter [Pseudanabaenaceae cyanobacterium bins.68]|nr:DMT family transporter [Pseudanabaenaceae cyanobacterium bins.68]
MELHRSSGRWRLGLFLALTTTFLWGILGVALKVTLQQVDPYTVTWFRFSTAFLVLLIHLAATQQLPSWSQFRPALPLLAIATISLLVNYICFLLGIAQTSPSNAQVIIQLAPVFLGLGSLIIFKERYTPLQWLGLSTLTLGLVLFFHAQLLTLVTNVDNYIWGSFLVVVAAVTWSFYALAQKQLLQQLSSYTIMMSIYGISALVLTPFAAPTKLFEISSLHWSSLIFCAINTLIAYGCFAEALDHWDASRISAVLTLTPLVTLATVALVANFLPSLFNAEPITLLSILGAVLVAVGSGTISLAKNSN